MSELSYFCCNRCLRIQVHIHVDRLPSLCHMTGLYDSDHIKFYNLSQTFRHHILKVLDNDIFISKNIFRETSMISLLIQYKYYLITLFIPKKTTRGLFCLLLISFINSFETNVFEHMYLSYVKQWFTVCTVYIRIQLSPSDYFFYRFAVVNFNAKRHKQII